MEHPSNISEFYLVYCDIKTLILLFIFSLDDLSTDVIRMLKCLLLLLCYSQFPLLWILTLSHLHFSSHSLLSCPTCSCEVSSHPIRCLRAPPASIGAWMWGDVNSASSYFAILTPTNHLCSKISFFINQAVECPPHKFCTSMSLCQRNLFQTFS